MKDSLLRSFAFVSFASLTNLAVAATPTISKLVLVRADTSAPIPGFDPIPDGAIINIAALPPGGVTIHARVAVAADVKSVDFALSDGSISRVENATPYSMTGDAADQSSGKWAHLNKTYTVTARAYAGKDRRGAAGPAFSRTITFTSERTVPPSETGWTEFKKAADTRVIYVSSTNGNDANDGLAPERAVKTPQRARSLTRSGFPDWILFKRGDTFNDAPLGYGGRSATEPFLLGAFGSGPRPLFALEINESPVDGCGFNKVITSLHFKSYRRDPSSASFDPVKRASSEDGVRCVNVTTANITFEDVVWEYFRLAIFYNGEYNGRTATNLKFHRNIIRNSWASGGGVRERKSQGVYMTGVRNVSFTENFFYQNGWNDKISGAGRSYLNHSLYVNDAVDFTAKGNISALSSSLGFKFNASNPSGTRNLRIEDNFIIDAANGITVVSNDKIARSFVNVTLKNNVHTHIGAFAQTDSGDITSQGLGVRLWHIENLSATGNLFIDRNWPVSNSPFVESSSVGTRLVSGNTAFDWVASGAGIVPSNDAASNDIEIASSAYIDTNRSLERYFGVANGKSELYRRMLSQRKGAWDPSATASAINAWYRAGFTKR